MSLSIISWFTNLLFEINFQNFASSEMIILLKIRSLIFLSPTNSTPDSIQCDFAISIEVFVDNTLHEEFYLWNFEKEMIDFCKDLSVKFVPEGKIFKCSLQ